MSDQDSNDDHDSNQVLPALLDLNPRRLDDRTIRLSTDPSFSNYTSAFGGWVAAVMIETLRRNPEFRGEVITQPMEVTGPVAADEVDITITLQARRTSIDFWRMEAHDPEGTLLVTADMACGDRSATEIRFEDSGPDLPPGPGQPMEITDMHPSWTSHFEQVMLEGEPFTVNERPRSVVKVRPNNAVVFDAAVLAMLCDSPMPRTFFASADFAFPSTISLSTHIYATDEQIAAVGGEFVIIETDSAVIRNNTLNQELHVFREDGLLLACSYQTALFR